MACFFLAYLFCGIANKYLCLYLISHVIWLTPWRLNDKNIPISLLCIYDLENIPDFSLSKTKKEFHAPPIWCRSIFHAVNYSIHKIEAPSSICENPGIGFFAFFNSRTEKISFVTPWKLKNLFLNFYTGLCALPLRHAPNTLQFCIRRTIN